MPIADMASAGAEPDAGGASSAKPQLVCPNCGATFEQVQTEGAAGGAGDEKSWEDDLRQMTARKPETEGEGE